jgi:hypothetical protein
MSWYFLKHDPFTYFALVASFSIVSVTIISVIIYSVIIGCGGIPAMSFSHGTVIVWLLAFISFIVFDLLFGGNFFKMKGEPIYLLGEFMGYAGDISGRLE